MKYKINLHAHTHFSDGVNTMEEMINEYIKENFSVMIVTDHIYFADYNKSNNIYKYIYQLAQAKELSEKYNYPIIVGAEFSFESLEEVVVIGTDAIIELLIIRDKKLRKNLSGRLLYTDLVEVKNKHNCFVSLCHPILNNDFISKGFYKILDAYENYNSGQNYFKYRSVPKEFKNLIALSNSDAHSIKALFLGYNLTNKEIKTEEDLFNYKDEFKIFNYCEEES